MLDKIYNLNDDKDSIQIHYNKNVSTVCKYVGTAANEASMGYGQYLVYVFGSQTGANYPTFTLDGRVRYYDN